MHMKLGNVIEFRKDLYFDGAVQADWFYDQKKAAKVAENFVFHGKDYFGADEKKDSIDTISLVMELAGKIGKSGSNPRSLAIADYGTGKSHLAVTMAQLFSGPQYMPQTYARIISNIKTIDSESAKKIASLCNERNFVIMLNGIRDFSLHSEILKATRKSMRLYGIDDADLKRLNHTIDTANRFFELNADSRKEDFEKAASNRNWNLKGNELISRIREDIGSDDTAFEIVNDVYEMTTGQRIRWEEGISAKAIVEMLLSNYCGLNGQFDSVVILFDEFGRYLEYASGTDGGRCGDNALQELFEVSQNAEGALHIINFIQADIKTYLLRVDPNRNLSRYIGRYDESDKYRISSNLETVFANLISRKDKEAFREIIEWQNKNEPEWKGLFEKIGKWTLTTGLWNSYDKYRKVVVEGIYPMHPVSVLMLTQLSGYLQNRSSMNLISRSIADVADIDLSQSIPLVLPVDLMRGDLYTEMLAAETSGRHRSDNCIRFENVLKKNEQKLNDQQITVLRANLVTRALRFNTRTYDEAVESLRVCSGLTLEQIGESLHILVDEYAVMAFDEMSGCFDFTEDAKGAYDYKIMKRRLLAHKKVDLRSLFGTSSILEKGGFDQTQPTNFGTLHKINTNEWCFTQQVIMAEDVTDDLADRLLTQWKKARSVVTPKGFLIWVYANKDTDYRVIDNLKIISEKLQGSPILMMLLNDSDNMLLNVLTEYDVVDHLDDNVRNAYSNVYVKDRARIEDNLRNAIDALKKKRERITPEGTISLKKRLPVALTDVFEEIYPDALPFNFDGLLTSANNFSGNGPKNYCQILKMLLSNKVNYDTIHDYPRDIRNRIDALFMVDNAASWKCITKECALIAPLNDKVRKIYDIVENEIEHTEEYNCGKFFDAFCIPPYGLSEETAAMFIGIILVDMWHNVRILYNEDRMTVTDWKDNIVAEKKININAFRESTILWVDTGSIEAKFKRLFDKINNNQSIDEAGSLKEELEKMVSFYGLPESQEIYYRFAKKRFSEFETAKRSWENQIGSIQDDLAYAERSHNALKALDCLEAVQSMPLSSIFKDGIEIPETCKGTMQKIRDIADSIIRNDFDSWLQSSVYCQSVDKMIVFERFYKGVRDRLRANGYLEQARKIETKGDKELKNKAEIKSRQELADDGKRFVSECGKASKKNYPVIKSLLKEAEELEVRFQKYGEALGKEALKVWESVEKYTSALKKQKKKMDEEMASVFDLVAEAETVDAIALATDCLGSVLGYVLEDKDRLEFIELQKILEELNADIIKIKSETDRSRFEAVASQIIKKYSSDECEYDFLPVIKDCIDSSRKELDKKDLQWRKDNLSLGDRSRKAVYSWKQRIEILPLYLKEETLGEIKKLDVEADQIISDGKIEDVVHYFNKLDRNERSRCLIILSDLKD